MTDLWPEMRAATGADFGEAPWETDDTGLVLHPRANASEDYTTGEDMAAGKLVPDGHGPAAGIADGQAYLDRVQNGLHRLLGR